MSAVELSVVDLSSGRKTDITSHHIEGFDPQSDAPHRCAPDLFSHIEGNLVMGGNPVGEAPEWAKFIVCLYPWEQYKRLEGQVYVEARLYDGANVPDVRHLAVMAQMVNAFCEIGPTLVHCQAGWNRSGLVTALALMMRGRTADEAIALLRARRSPDVLCNSHFEGWLRSVTIEGLA